MAPMVPFMASDCDFMFKSLATKVIKSEVVQFIGGSTIRLTDYEAKDDDLLNATKIDIVFSANKKLKELHIKKKVKDSHSKISCRFGIW